jgi:hypothetical protein
LRTLQPVCKQGYSDAVGGGRHNFPHVQKFYIRKSRRLAEPTILNEIEKPETVEVPENLVQVKEPIPKKFPPNSSSSEDDVDRYKIMVRKRSTRPQNKFRLKYKSMYNPTIKDKVIVINEEITNPNVKPSTRKKVSKIRSEKNKIKKEDITTNKKAPIGKDRFSVRK